MAGMADPADQRYCWPYAAPPRRAAHI